MGGSVIIYCLFEGHPDFVTGLSI